VLCVIPVGMPKREDVEQQRGEGEGQERSILLNIFEGTLKSQKLFMVRREAEKINIKI
jgi:hypothetical protein